MFAGLVCGCNPSASLKLVRQQNDGLKVKHALVAAVAQPHRGLLLQGGCALLSRHPRREIGCCQLQRGRSSLVRHASHRHRQLQGTG